MLLLPDRDLRTARRIAERLRQRIDAAAMAHPSSTVAPHVTVSIGVGVLLPARDGVAEQLIMAADRALYAAKARGRNRVVGVARTSDPDSADRRQRTRATTPRRQLS